MQAFWLHDFRDVLSRPCMIVVDEEHCTLLMHLGVTARANQSKGYLGHVTNEALNIERYGPTEF